MIFTRGVLSIPSTETQDQIVGPRESLNWRENVARRKVKNGEKSSSRRSLLFFVPYIFSRPFRLSLAPFICPLVSEDVGIPACDVYVRLETTGAAVKIARGTTDNQ